MLLKTKFWGIVFLSVSVVLVCSPAFAEHTVISEVSITEASMVFSFEREDLYTDTVVLTDGKKTMSINLQKYDYNYMIKLNKFGTTLKPSVQIKRHWTGHHDIVVGKPPLKN